MRLRAAADLINPTFRGCRNKVGASTIIGDMKAVPGSTVVRKREVSVDFSYVISSRDVERKATVSKERQESERRICKTCAITVNVLTRQQQQ